MKNTDQEEITQEEEHIDSEFKLDGRHTATTEIIIRRKKVPINTHLYKNLMHIKRGIEDKFDGIILFDGMEGSGKSELAMQCALVIDPSFTEEDVFYTIEQFEHWLEHAPIGKAGVWDEFALAGLSSEGLTTVQILLVKKFVLIRKKRLFIALVVPYFFMLKRYFATARSRALIHVYTKGMTRGYFRLYNYRRKLRLYVTGYKYMDYTMGKVYPNFEGRFKVWSQKFVDDEKVQEKKDKAIEDIGTVKFSLTKRRLAVLKDIFVNMIGTNPYNNKEEQDAYLCFRKMKEILEKVKE